MNRHPRKNDSPGSTRRHPPQGGELPTELEFEADRETSRSRAEDGQRFPRERVREAGRTGGELPRGGVTADDATRETLLDDDPSRTPSVRSTRDAADQQLDVVPASRIGGGTGLDEAELAQAEPVGLNVAAGLRAQAERHAHDARYAEPAGAREARERESQYARRAGTKARPRNPKPRVH
jgi:hypothetical protein